MQQIIPSTVRMAFLILFSAPFLFGQNHAGSTDAVEKKLQSPDAAVVRLLAIYESISQALVADDLGLAKAHAAELSASAEKSGSLELANLAMSVAGAETLEESREAFKPLSASVIAMAQDQGQYVTMVCPMVSNGRWLQSSVTTANPYMGQAMPQCGKPEISIRPDGSKATSGSGCCGS
tara:strand:- start:3853 stop:4389 length:537 start_codon:yes stop_codon:yes gene_type:complete